MNRTNDEILTNINSSIEQIKLLLYDMYNTEPSKADKLSYWFQNYVTYRKEENAFDPSELKHYKRGDIIKVNLGFRIGAELGGLHYAIVLDNNNSIHNKNITVIPLISSKQHIDLNKLSTDRLYLGDELKSKIIIKCQNQINAVQQRINILTEQIKNNKISTSSKNIELEKLQNIINANDKAIKEVKKMKHGSIALLNQITTISKLRIYDPKSAIGVLHNVRISTNFLDEINKRLISLYIHV